MQGAFQPKYSHIKTIKKHIKMYQFDAFSDEKYLEKQFVPNYHTPLDLDLLFMRNQVYGPIQSLMRYES